MTPASRARGGGAEAGLRGGAGLRAGLLPSTVAAQSQPGNLGLAEIPQLAPALCVDLAVFGELTQPLVADVQLVSSDSQGDQAVLRHRRDSSAYPKQSTTRLLANTPNNW